MLDETLGTTLSWWFQIKELQQSAINHSSDIDFKDFMKVYEKCTAKPYSFLVSDTTLPSCNPLRFRLNCLEEIYNNHGKWWRDWK